MATLTVPMKLLLLLDRGGPVIADRGRSGVDGVTGTPPFGQVVLGGALLGGRPPGVWGVAPPAASRRSEYGSDASRRSLSISSDSQRTSRSTDSRPWRWS